MTQAMFKRGDGHITATLRYPNKTYEVRIVPLASGFEATKVTDGHGKTVTGDERYTIMGVAVRELMAWYKVKLNPPSHVKVTFAERVTIAFAFTLQQLEDNVKAKLVPLGYYDLRLLERAANELSDSIAKAQTDARNTGHKLRSGYAHELKRDQLRRLGKLVLCSTERRDFYSSVLSRVFAWKGGRIPHHDYETAQIILPGLRLAFSLKE